MPEAPATHATALPRQDGRALRPWSVRSLWRGDIPLGRAFWEYAVGYGTLLNVSTTIASLAILAADGPPVLAGIVFFLAAPYTITAVTGVWRSAGRYQGPRHWADIARIAVVAWAAVATLL